MLGEWIYVLDELTGIIISRRPNRRESIDKAPGPRHTSASAITADSADVMRVSSKPKLEIGAQANMLLTSITAAARATYRVRSPISSRKPMIIMAKATAKMMNVGSCISLKYAPA